jgi:hypothetical protein
MPGRQITKVLFAGSNACGRKRETEERLRACSKLAIQPRDAAFVEGETERAKLKVCQNALCSHVIMDAVDN